MKKIRKTSLKMKVTSRKLKIMAKFRKSLNKKLQKRRNARKAEETRREELLRVRKETMVRQKGVEGAVIVIKRADIGIKVEMQKRWSGKRSLVRRRLNRIYRKKMFRKILIKSLKIKKILDLLNQMKVKSKFRLTR